MRAISSSCRTRHVAFYTYATFVCPRFCIVILTVRVVFLRAFPDHQARLRYSDEYRPKIGLFRLNLNKLWSFPQTRYLKVPPVGGVDRGRRFGVG